MVQSNNRKCCHSEAVVIDALSPLFDTKTSVRRYVVLPNLCGVA
jgi:hypothetical protein